MFDYYCLRQLIDGYLSNQIPTWTLAWFQNQINKYKKSFQICIEGKPIDYLATKQVAFSPKGYEFKENALFIGDLMYSLDLGEVFGKIHLEIMDLLKEQKDLKRCQAPKTQKSPACKNIFIPYEKGKEQLYCSPRCTNRARRLKYYSKTGK